MKEKQLQVTSEAGQKTVSAWLGGSVENWEKKKYSRNISVKNIKNQ